MNRTPFSQLRNNQHILTGSVKQLTFSLVIT